MSDETGDEELLQQFASILSGSFELPDNGIESSVDALLVNGTTLRFHGLDANTLAAALHEYGWVQMQDENGKVAYVFDHGVAAITGTGGNSE